MDTVTDARLAIAIARQGGIGFIHRNMSIDRQAEEVDRVKRSESGMIVDPVTIAPELSVRQALDIMNKYKVSGLPVTRGQRLVGILTNRDLRFERNLDQPVSAIMTKDNLVTVPVGTTLDEAERILQQHRIEKLLVVDKDFNLKGLITVKDIQKKIEFPNAAKDEQGRLRVGAAIGATGDFLERAQELAHEKVDVLAIDTAHGHTTRVMEAIREVKHKLPETAAARRKRRHGRRRARPDRARNRRPESGHRPGLDLHDARGHRRGRAADHGDPGMRARRKRQRRADDRRRRNQIFGRHHEGDRCRRFRRDDRRAVCGHRRIAGRNDSLSGPHVQDPIAAWDRSARWKRARPTATRKKARSAASRCRRESKARFLTKGRSRGWSSSSWAGCAAAWDTVGVENLKELQERSKFIRISSAGLRESHVHDVIITREAPNYRLE